MPTYTVSTDGTGFQPSTPQMDVSAGTSPVQPSAPYDSTANLVKDLGNLGQSIFKGYEQAKIETGVEALTGRYLQTAKDEGLNVPMLDNPVEKAKFEAAQKRYKQYADAGPVMSQKELTARVEAYTQQMINNWPGMAKEFMQMRDQALGRYSENIALVQDQYNNLAKGAEEDKYFTHKNADHLYDAWTALGGDIVTGNDLAYGSGDAGRVKLAALLKGQTQVLELANKQTSINNLVNQLDISDKEKERMKMPAFAANTVINADQEVSSVLGVSNLSTVAAGVYSTADQARMEANLTAWVNAKKVEFNNKFKNSVGTPQAQQYYDYLEQMHTMVNKFITTKFKSDDAAQQLAMMKSQYGKMVLGQGGPEVRFLVGVTAAAGPYAMSNDSVMMQQFKGELSAGMSSALNKAAQAFKVNSLNIFNSAWMTADEQHNAAMAGYGAVDAMEKTGTPAGDAQEVNTLFGFVNGMDGKDQQASISTDNYKRIFQVLARPDFTRLQKTHPDETAKIIKLGGDAIDAYITKAAGDLTAKVNADPEIKNQIELGIDASGELAFVPKNNTLPAISQAKYFNSMYQFGTMAKAWSKLYGKSQKDLLVDLAKHGRFPDFSVKKTGE